MNLDDYINTGRTKVALYGPPKSGKTAVVGELAKAGFRCHVFDFEHGAKTLLNPAILPPEFRKNVLIYNIPDHREYPIAIDVLRELYKGGSKRYCWLHGKPNCALCSRNAEAKWSAAIDLATFTDKDILILDSWTQIAKSALNKVTLKEWSKDKEEFKATFNHYGHQGMLQDEILSKIQVSDTNTMVVFHEVDTEKVESSKEKISPFAGTREFSKTVAKYFDEVVYMHVMNKKHSMYSATTWSNSHVTGGRSGVQVEKEGGKGIVDMFTGASK